jgi:isoquinoline 1-oxidoreductase beta subunit
MSGSTALRYAMGSRLVEYVEQPSGMQIGYWRSVGESISCFVVESAIDECARAAGIDPYQYRRTLLAGNTASLAVLDAAAKLAGWGTAPAKGHARGIALSPGFGSLCAIVAELALSSSGKASVVRISCAIDCGTAVNPDQVVGQMEGGILHGMNAALWQQVTFSKGVSSVRNFGNYLMGRMTGSPKINVVIVSQGSTLGGTGEAGVPGVAPALANAYAALTGTRKRSLPLGFVAAPPNDD